MTHPFGLGSSFEQRVRRGVSLAPPTLRRGGTNSSSLLVPSSRHVEVKEVDAKSLQRRKKKRETLQSWLEAPRRLTQPLLSQATAQRSQILATLGKLSQGVAMRTLTQRLREARSQAQKQGLPTISASLALTLKRHPSSPSLGEDPQQPQPDMVQIIDSAASLSVDPAAWWGWADLDDMSDEELILQGVLLGRRVTLRDGVAWHAEWLEADWLNEQGGVALILRALDCMILKFEPSLVKESFVDGSAEVPQLPLPGWLATILQGCSDEGTGFMPRLALLRVICLRARVLLPFARHLLPLIHAAVLDSRFGAAKSFHYPLRDICQTLILWEAGGARLGEAHPVLVEAIASHLARVSAHPDSTWANLAASLVGLLLVRWTPSIHIDALPLLNLASAPLRNDAGVVFRWMGLSLLTSIAEGAVVASSTSLYSATNELPEIWKTKLPSIILESLGTPKLASVARACLVALLRKSWPALEDACLAHLRATADSPDVNLLLAVAQAQPLLLIGTEGSAPRRVLGSLTASVKSGAADRKLAVLELLVRVGREANRLSSQLTTPLTPPMAVLVEAQKASRSPLEVARQWAGEGARELGILMKPLWQPLLEGGSPPQRELATRLLLTLAPWQERDDTQACLAFLEPHWEAGLKAGARGQPESWMLWAVRLVGWLASRSSSLIHLKRLLVSAAARGRGFRAADFDVRVTPSDAWSYEALLNIDNPVERDVFVEATLILDALLPSDTLGRWTLVLQACPEKSARGVGLALLLILLSFHSQAGRQIVDPLRQQQLPGASEWTDVAASLGTLKGLQTLQRTLKPSGILHSVARSLKGEAATLALSLTQTSGLTSASVKRSLLASTQNKRPTLTFGATQLPSALVALGATLLGRPPPAQPISAEGVEETAPIRMLGGEAGKAMGRAIGIRRNERAKRGNLHESALRDGALFGPSASCRRSLLLGVLPDVTASIQDLLLPLANLGLHGDAPAETLLLHMLASQFADRSSDSSSVETCWKEIHATLVSEDGVGESLRGLLLRLMTTDSLRSRASQLALEVSQNHLTLEGVKSLVRAPGGRLLLELASRGVSLPASPVPSPGESQSLLSTGSISEAAGEAPSLLFPLSIFETLHEVVSRSEESAVIAMAVGNSNQTDSLNTDLVSPALQLEHSDTALMDALQASPLVDVNPLLARRIVEAQVNLCKWDAIAVSLDQKARQNPESLSNRDAVIGASSAVLSRILRVFVPVPGEPATSILINPRDLAQTSSNLDSSVPSVVRHLPPEVFLHQALALLLEGDVDGARERAVRAWEGDNLNLGLASALVKLDALIEGRTSELLMERSATRRPGALLVETARLSLVPLRDSSMESLMAMSLPVALTAAALARPVPENHFTPAVGLIASRFFGDAARVCLGAGQLGGTDALIRHALAVSKADHLNATTTVQLKMRQDVGKENERLIKLLSSYSDVCSKKMGDQPSSAVAYLPTLLSVQSSLVAAHIRSFSEHPDSGTELLSGSLSKAWALVASSADHFPALSVFSQGSESSETLSASNRRVVASLAEMVSLLGDLSDEGLLEVSSPLMASTGAETVRHLVRCLASLEVEGEGKSLSLLLDLLAAHANLLADPSLRDCVVRLPPLSLDSQIPLLLSHLAVRETSLGFNSSDPFVALVTQLLTRTEEALGGRIVHPLRTAAAHHPGSPTIQNLAKLVSARYLRGFQFASAVEMLASPNIRAGQMYLAPLREAIRQLHEDCGRSSSAMNKLKDADGAMSEIRKLLENFLRSLAFPHLFSPLGGEVGEDNLHLSGIVQKMVGSKLGLVLKCSSLSEAEGKVASVFDAFLGLNLNTAYKTIVEWGKQVEETPLPSAKKAKPGLSSFCSWLLSSDTGGLDMPGAPPCPDPSRRVLVRRFLPSVLVLASKQKPKRIAAVGSDGRTRLLLAKAGDDLRLDQRVMQLFSLANDLTGASQLEERDDLQIPLFAVVPTGSQLGVLGWVRHTAPFKTVLEREAERREPARSSRRSVASRQDETALEKLSGVVSFKRLMATMQRQAGDKGGDFPKIYQYMYTKTDSVQIERQFRYEVQANVPADLIAESLLRGVSSPQAYVTVRRRLLASLGASNAVGYLLGVGDRHVENILIEGVSGRVVAIDFGYSLGVGARLPVPELMPFRLTPNFGHLEAPLASSLWQSLEENQPTDSARNPVLRGTHFRSLQSVLSVVRVSQREFASHLASFAREPLVEWVSEERNKKQTTTPSTGLSENQESPIAVEGAGFAVARERVSICRQKLEGVAPRDVLLAELRSSGREWVRELASSDKFLKEVLRRHPTSDRRLTPTQQAAALTLLATDPGLLARTWKGWCPHL